MQSDYPSFSDALDRFRDFLDLHGWPVEIKWLCHKTLAFRPERLVLKDEDFQDAESVRTAYWYAVPQKRGVLLAGLCRDTAFSYCYLWYPSDEDEADDHLMPDGLKLSLPLNPPPVVVANGWRFRWHSRRTRQIPLEGLMLNFPSSPDSQRIHV